MNLGNIYKFMRYKSVFYTKMSRDVIAEINSMKEEVCDWKINPGYIERALKNFDCGYAYYDK